MKKLLSFLAMSAIVLGMAFTFNACGGNDANNPEEPNNPEKTVFDNDYFHVEVSVKEMKAGIKPIIHIKIAPKSTVYKYIMDVSSKFYADNAWGSAWAYLAMGDPDAIYTKSHYNTGTPIEYDDSDRQYDTEYVVILFALDDKNKPIEETWTKAPFKTPVEPKALSGKFTVDANGKQVYFSKANLQATTTDLGVNWTWGFVKNQWNYFSGYQGGVNTCINGNGTVSYDGSVDLFGWSTPATYYGINNSTTLSDHSGKFEEWGATICKGWYTLSMDEWVYLFYGRTDAAHLFGMGTVNGESGVILLPDNWAGDKFTDTDSGLADQGDHYYNENGTNYSFHTFTDKQWSDMAANGAVFLPAAGYRAGTIINNPGLSGEYWSSTPGAEGYAYSVSFDPEFLAPKTHGGRYYGCSVRLVKEVK